MAVYRMKINALGDFTMCGSEVICHPGFGMSSSSSKNGNQLSLNCDQSVLLVLKSNFQIEFKNRVKVIIRLTAALE